MKIPNSAYKNIMEYIYKVQMGGTGDDALALANALENLMLYVEVDD